ncbi:transmembrane 7 superfamily member 3 [Notothenia coriiceps]|uniref:Transmembrane 7 superfamily member 3 n=1 Tax=Notothenia coriiceps TaxID=8208 RepID=A0A6I9Q6A1_9TELE|nr:PREDICTED: transmembrane 7 superfamily member 3 [Notothenia coriiceps]
MSLWIWCPLLLLVCKVQAQMENRVIFLPGTFQNVSVSQNETVQAVVSRIPPEVAFITLQFHTQHRNATLSYTRIPGPGTSLTAVDSGLLAALLPGQVSLSLFLSSPDGDTVVGTGVILPYSSSDPLPGACNTEFTLDIDPNVYIHYNLYETEIRFAPANLGNERGETPSPCDISTEATTRWRLQYDIYQYFLPENDLSERSLFTGIQAVADIQGMMENGRLVMTLLSSDMSMVVFTSIPGQGVVYSVVVRDPLLNTSASYVPSHTYACSFVSTLDGCQTLGKISTKVFFTIAGMAGLFICFFGHRFFKCELFCMGFSFATFFFFVLVTRTTGLEYDMCLAVSAVIGVVGGVLLVMSWWRFGSVMACIVVVGLMLGFLIASTVLFTPLGDLDVFRRSDAVFWVTFCCIMLIVPLFFVRWPREGNIITCGVVGAYAVVLAVNAYIYTSLSYISLNILKRFLNNNFSAVFTDVPFQAVDYIMITAWVVLGVSGMVLQLYRERSRPFFPPSPYLMWLQERERRKTNVLDPSHHCPPLPNRLLARVRQLTKRMESVGENTPLLL